VQRLQRRERPHRWLEVRSVDVGIVEAQLAQRLIATFVDAGVVDPGPLLQASQEDVAIAVRKRASLQFQIRAVDLPHHARRVRVDVRAVCHVQCLDGAVVSAVCQHATQDRLHPFGTGCGDLLGAAFILSWSIGSSVRGAVQADNLLDEICQVVILENVTAAVSAAALFMIVIASIDDMPSILLRWNHPNEDVTSQLDGNVVPDAPDLMGWSAKDEDGVTDVHRGWMACHKVIPRASAVEEAVPGTPVDVRRHRCWFGSIATHTCHLAVCAPA